MERKLFMGVLALCLFMALLFPTGAYAAGPVDSSKTGSLFLSCQSGSTVLKDLKVQIYRVGDISASAIFTLVGAYKDDPVNVRDIDTASAWLAAAKTLADHVAADHLTPTATATTDSHGDVTFTNLKAGLYLILAERPTDAAHKNMTYDLTPFLLSLPSLEEGDWIYNLTAYPKWAYVPVTPTPSPTPSPTPKPDKLPQTGQLWWPIPLMAGGGLILFALGWHISRKSM